MSKQDVYYGDYLQLDKILNAQELESEKAGVEAHDEMLFIVVHQAYELWFKQVLYEIESIQNMMGQPEINDNGPGLQTAVHRLERCVEILKLLVQQVTIMETMTPMDFLEFRDLLRPASGFQSYQFKLLEARLGLKLEHRHGKAYYLSQLRQEHIDMIAKVEAQKSIIELLNAWLERMPFFDQAENWVGFKPSEHEDDKHDFWASYRHNYYNSLTEGEKGNMERFDKLFFDPEFTKDRRLSNKANRAALFIMLYRSYPLLQLPFRMLNLLLEVDEQLALWRIRHINMVHRIIGTRVGTGGSSGKDYLKASADKHYIFQEIAELSSFLIGSQGLPELPQPLAEKLSFKL
jgi:tryptophan 2,3-dioxygenase